MYKTLNVIFLFKNTIVYCQYMSVFLSIKCLESNQDPNAQRANGS